jgi:hypothetical protein
MNFPDIKAGLLAASTVIYSAAIFGQDYTRERGGGGGGFGPEPGILVFGALFLLAFFTSYFAADEDIGGTAGYLFVIIMVGVGSSTVVGNFWPYVICQAYVAYKAWENHNES